MTDIVIEDHPEPTYIELIVEARWNSTEKKETIINLLKKFLEGDVIEDNRFDGNYLLIRNSSRDGLQLLGEWVREQQQVDTLRERLFRSIVNNITALYFNRQAAAMGRISLVDINDNPPNGPVIFQIVSDGLNKIINELTPRTYKGKIVSEAEWEKIQAQLARNREKKRREREL